MNFLRMKCTASSTKPVANPSDIARPISVSQCGASGAAGDGESWLASRSSERKTGDRLSTASSGIAGYSSFGKSRVERLGARFGERCLLLAFLAELEVGPA